MTDQIAAKYIEHITPEILDCVIEDIENGGTVRMSAGTVKVTDWTGESTWYYRGKRIYKEEFSAMPWRLAGTRYTNQSSLKRLKAYIDAELDA